MVTRHERLLNEQRALQQNICSLMVRKNSFIDIIGLIPTMAAMREEALEAGYHAQTNSYREPLFDGNLTRNLVRELVNAQLAILKGPVGTNTAKAIIDSIAATMGEHHLAPRERSRVSARRDVARAEICLASAEAFSIALNMFIAQRIPKRRRNANRKGGRR